MSAPIHPEFAQKFQDAWAAPPIESLTALLADDVRLIQPLSSPIRGKKSARKAFRKILFRFHGLKGEVTRGYDHGNTQIIDWTMIVPIAGSEYRVPVIDLFTLGKDGLVRKRVAYFDPMPLLGPIMRSPAIWARYLGSVFLK